MSGAQHYMTGSIYSHRSVPQTLQSIVVSTHSTQNRPFYYAEHDKQLSRVGGDKHAGNAAELLKQMSQPSSLMAFLRPVWGSVAGIPIGA